MGAWLEAGCDNQLQINKLESESMESFYMNSMDFGKKNGRFKEFRFRFVDSLVEIR